MIDNRTAPYAATLLRISLGTIYVAHSLVLKHFTFTLPGTAQFFESLGLPGALAYLTFWAELIGVTTCFVTLSVLSVIVYFIAEKLVGNRVSKEVEIEGLDVPEMGVAGYNGMVMDKQSETPMAH